MANNSNGSIESDPNQPYVTSFTESASDYSSGANDFATQASWKPSENNYSSDSMINNSGIISGEYNNTSISGNSTPEVSPPLFPSNDGSLGQSSVNSGPNLNPNQTYPSQNPYTQSNAYNMNQNAPQAPSYNNNPDNLNRSNKSKIIAGLLAIFLGSLGIHNFYLGKTSLAVTQLLITVLSLFFLSWAVAIWALIEGVLILVSEPNTSWHKDGEGKELLDNL